MYEPSVRPVVTGTSVTLPPLATSMTRTTSWPDPFCFTAAMGTVRTLVSCWSMTLIVTAAPSAAAEVGDLDLALVHLLATARPAPAPELDVEPSASVGSSSEIVPGHLVGPADELDGAVLAHLRAWCGPRPTPAG